ncbi:unnamed protein product [Mesocestoides corti]|uniref:Uncharacterized protein n=1 Tax=Mesocestoides corti TaxID=53468 RepID=A0A0R3UGX9_MESCO|nr:unnamed protein product [Mesocestoides corti]
MGGHRFTQVTVLMLSAVRAFGYLCIISSAYLHLGNVGTCLTHLSALTKCLSDADCPETKCCHRQRHHGGFGICAYVCNDIGTASTVPFDKPVGSYRGGDFWKLWAHKRHVTFPHRHKRQW